MESFPYLRHWVLGTASSTAGILCRSISSPLQVRKRMFTLRLFSDQICTVLDSCSSFEQSLLHLAIVECSPQTILCTSSSFFRFDQRCFSWRLQLSWDGSCPFAMWESRASPKLVSGCPVVFDHHPGIAVWAPWWLLCTATGTGITCQTKFPVTSFASSLAVTLNHFPQ